MTGTVAEQLARRAYLQAQAQSTLSDEPDVQAVPVIRRIGLGLPLSYIYATYFGELTASTPAGVVRCSSGQFKGGSLDVVSLEGWGIDVYIRLPRLGTNLEGIQV